MQRVNHVVPTMPVRAEFLVSVWPDVETVAVVENTLLALGPFFDPEADTMFWTFPRVPETTLLVASSWLIWHTINETHQNIVDTVAVSLSCAFDDDDAVWRLTVPTRSDLIVALGSHGVTQPAFISVFASEFRPLPPS